MKKVNPLEMELLIQIPQLIGVQTQLSEGKAFTLHSYDDVSFAGFQRLMTNLQYKSHYLCLTGEDISLM